MVIELIALVTSVTIPALVGLFKAGKIFSDIKASIFSLEQSVSRLDTTLNQLKVEIQKDLDSKMSTHTTVNDLNIREKFHAVRNDMNQMKHDMESYTDFAMQEHINEYHKK